MAADTIQFIERIVGAPVPLIGYSAGAMVALWTAARRPDLISRLVLISGAFDADGMMFKPVADVPMPAPLVTAYQVRSRRTEWITFRSCRRNCARRRPGSRSHAGRPGAYHLPGSCGLG